MKTAPEPSADDPPPATESLVVNKDVFAAGGTSSYFAEDDEHVANFYETIQHLISLPSMTGVFLLLCALQTGLVLVTLGLGVAGNCYTFAIAVTCGIFGMLYGTYIEGFHISCFRPGS